MLQLEDMLQALFILSEHLSNAKKVVFNPTSTISRVSLAVPSVQGL